MVRLRLFAEGATEQTFADNVLKGHLANHGVYMEKPVLIAHARKKGKVHRGGGRKFKPMQNDICRFLKQESGQNVFFSTMIDLYALHKDFPGLEQAENLRFDPYKRVQALEKSWLDETGDKRFIPFIQLHEFEGYLFSDISQFASFFDNADSRISALRKSTGKFPSPELIDDGLHTAPSKRILSQFPDYSKVTTGPQMAERIGLETIRSNCPHFNAWVGKLENLGTNT